MKWTGHILRMSDNKTVKQVFRWEPSSRCMWAILATMLSPSPVHEHGTIFQ